MPGRWLRLTITFGLALITLKHFGTLLGRDPGMALLILLMTLKLFELHRLRDFSFTLFLLYFLCLGAFLYSQSLWIAAYALGIAAITTSSLVQAGQPLTLPIGYLCRLSLNLLVRAVPLMLVMYFLFPRIHGTLWGLPVDAYSGLTGLTDTVKPGAINQLLGNDAVAFRAEFEGELPPNRELYWRALVLTDTDGISWVRSRIARGSVKSQSYQPIGTHVDYTVTLEPHNRPWLVALDLPATVPAGAEPLPGYVLTRRAPLRERVRYALRSYPRYNTGELLERESRETRRLSGKISSRLRALVAGWQALHSEPSDIVRAALTHFNQEGFVYTLTPPLLGRNPVDEFLFETRRGYCEHYASAFVTLMRTAGIPSRMVIGYQGGELNALGDYLIVRQSDAHAWAEVWLAGRGWVRVDPTAAVAPERIELGTDALLRLAARGSSIGALPPEAILGVIELGWLQRNWRTVVLSWDVVNNAWNRWVLDYGPEAQRLLMRRLGFDTPSWTHMASTLAAGVSLLLLLLAGLLLRQPNPDPALACYQRFCRKLARMGLYRATHEGPLDFAERASRLHPELATNMHAITELYVAIRYGNHDGGSVLSELKARVRRFPAPTLGR